MKRPMLLSSRAASTSSRMQKGLGFDLKMARSRATAVSDFSPPERRRMLVASLPGGLAMISTPASRTSTPASSTMSALPPPKSFR